MNPPTPVPSPYPSARERVMYMPELAGMLARAIGCTRSIVRMQNANKEFRRYSPLLLASIFVPELFVKTFFGEPAAAVAMIRRTGSIMCGDPLREYMYTMAVRTSRLVIVTNGSFVDEVANYLLDNNYSLYDTGRINPFEAGTCAVATCILHFRRQVDKDTITRVTIHGALHNPMRLLLRTTLPYAMQFCDGHRFVDLYPRLGPDGPRALVSRGRHAHLLDPAELLRHLPPQVFDLRIENPTLNVVPIERWVGDSSTWVIPCTDASAGTDPDPTGWTIRLNGRRSNNSPYSHFWTTTHCRCLRHDFLTREYVVPQPAHKYATRVLDKMHDVLAVGVGETLANMDGSAIDFDVAAQQAISAFRAGRSFAFRIDNFKIEVELDGCEY